MYLKVNLDIDISYEEANFLKETFMANKNIREISLIQEKISLDTTTDDTPDASFESGFNNVTYFIKVFKAVKGDSPLVYQKKINV